VDVDHTLEAITSINGLKLQELIRATQGPAIDSQGPSLGLTIAAPRFKKDLEALLFHSQSKEPTMRQVRSSDVILTAYYGFGDASSDGFGSTVARPGGLHGRYGLWSRDIEDQSSNYRELRNLVGMVEEEAKAGYLEGSELWMFTDDYTLESCFHKGNSSSELLHELVLRLRKIELDHCFILHGVHVSGTRMIAQGTDGLSRGSFLEGVMTGKDMLAYVDLAKGTIERQPTLVDYVQSWVKKALRWEARILQVEEWFQEGHGVLGGSKNSHGVWIPNHEPNGRVYLWNPPPVIADVALEECMKAVHKRTDAFHIFLIPRLYSPAWLRILYKLSDFTFAIPPCSQHWPRHMHEPLFIGISLPLIRCCPWSVR